MQTNLWWQKTDEWALGDRVGVGELWGDGYVHWVDCDDGFTGVIHMSKNPTVHFKYVLFMLIICH